MGFISMHRSFCTGLHKQCNGKNATEADNIYSELPFQMNKVQLPVFPDYSRSITEFGAVADGITLNTEAFDKAIKAVAEKGGGKVIVPAGLWLTGPIVLQSNINLYLEENSTGAVYSRPHTVSYRQNFIRRTGNTPLPVTDISSQR